MSDSRMPPGAPSDRIVIEDLHVDAVIGVHDWETAMRQPLLLRIELEFDNRVPAASGALADAVDYAAVAGAVREHAAAFSGALLEQFAEQCCAMLAARFGVRAVTLQVDKPLAALALDCARVGVRVQRRFDA